MTELITQTPEEIELNSKINKILLSPARKILVVAGPGTGKTSLFRTILENSPGLPENRIVLTFINTLKDDLDRDLGSLARVYTLHSFCLRFLYQYPSLCLGLKTDFEVYPRLASLIGHDWEIINETKHPKFLGDMRDLVIGKHLSFYIDRGNYYNAVDFDDIVYRAYNGFTSGLFNPGVYDFVLIDEYQDFNLLEAGIVDILGETNKILISGDDDQALYSQLRNASWDHIRSLSRNGVYEVHNLPFCMRCPKVIVDAVNNILAKANETQNLQGRIIKPFKDFPKVKESDSLTYPKIIEVETSVQRKDANYMGKFIAQEVEKIQKVEIEEANKKGFPVVLVIAAEPYRKQIIEYLIGNRFEVETRKSENKKINRESGLLLLKQNPNSNLGWRIILEVDKPSFMSEAILSTADGIKRIVDEVPDAYREAILVEVDAYNPTEGESLVEESKTEMEIQLHPAIRVSSFEGSKGISAQHVFIVGLHNGDLPRDPNVIKDLEICKLIVGLTRTRKKCTILYTKRFCNKLKSPSIFISWINNDNFEFIKVNKSYWDNQKRKIS